MDVALKQRLVGATVLIALAVIVLPMLLSGRPEQTAQESQKIELPPQPDELDFQTRRYPIGETPSPSSRAVPATAEPSPGTVSHVEIPSREFEDALQSDSDSANGAGAGQLSTEVAPGAPGEERPEEVATAESGGAVERTASTVSRPVAGGGRYVVQVASFGSLDNANRLTERLRGEGYAVLSDTVKSDVGTLHRVRVGPFESEAAANEAVSRIRQRVDGVRPRIVDLKPDLSAQVTAPSDPLVRWVVQVGSFSSADNADKLVERLRADGLSAYKEAVSSSGSIIYRVRVGPYVERDEAIRIDGLVNERFSLDGVVMSAD